MKNWKWTALLFAVVLFAVSCAGVQQAAKTDVKAPLEVTVIHINDHHSHLEPVQLEMMIGGKKTKVMLGGYPEVLNAIKELKTSVKNPITLHAGDAITGTLYFTLFGGSADAALMNISGFDLGS